MQGSTSFFTDLGLLGEISRYCRHKKVARGETLIPPGSEVFFVPIVESGALRIIRQNDDGQEVFLYHLHPGQTCAMAISCCQGRHKSNIKAIAEEDSEILQVPVDLVDEWFKYPEWKLYINSTYAARFAELLDVIDLIAFSNMDRQLLHYLQERAKVSGSKKLNITHQEIADELHTHREAVSRLLRTMQQKEIVKLGRNSIELTDFQ